MLHEEPPWDVVHPPPLLLVPLPESVDGMSPFPESVPELPVSGIPISGTLVSAWATH